MRYRPRRFKLKRVLWNGGTTALPRVFVPVLLAGVSAISFAGQRLNPDTNATKLDSILQKLEQSKHPHGTSKVIVKADPTNPKVRALFKSLGVKVYADLSIIQSVGADVPTKNLRLLAGSRLVHHVSSDMVVHKTDAFTDTHSFAYQAFQAYPTLNTSAVKVGVLDTGVNPVGDLASVDTSHNWASQDRNNYDDNGHGTHVAGIISGTGAGSRGSGFWNTFQGVASNPTSLSAPAITSMKVLGPDGSGLVSDVVKAMSWIAILSNLEILANPKSPAHRHILNLSIGHPVAESYTTDPLTQACETCWKNGVVVVVAAGNEGRVQNVSNSSLGNEGFGTNYGSIDSPGNDPYVITVGAMKNWDGNRSNDRIATYSSRGPTRLDYVLKPDLVAPGNKVVSLDAGLIGNPASYGWLHSHFPGNVVPTASYYNGSNSLASSYYLLSGTSMAAPVVSGAAAMMFAKDMTLTPDTIKVRLMLTADKWADPTGVGDPCTYGAGYVNVLAAMNSTVVPTTSAISPTMSYDSSGNVYLDPLQSMFGLTLSGQRAIWGVGGVTDYRAIWGSRAMWGSSVNTISSSRAMWGQSVWTNRAMWGVATFQADFSLPVIYGE